VSSRGITVVEDMETGALFDAEPHLIQELVRDEIGKFMRQLEEGARRHGLHMVRCLTDNPVQDVLVEYLRRRARIHNRGATKG